MTTNAASMDKSLRSRLDFLGAISGLRVHDDSVAQRVVRDGLVGLGESYMDGAWSAKALDEALYDVFTSPPIKLSVRAQARLLLAAVGQRALNRQSGKRAFDIGIRHYDLGNDLFRCMLDESMSYTCGYWANALNLADAQRAKLDLICRKLDVRPGQHILDIGCGWGNFAHHAATHYGARVTGVTVSREQAGFAQERCRELPVEICLLDYRRIKGSFDHVVSIEMIEAVGRRNVPEFFAVVDRCLRTRGLFVLQVISGNTLTRTSDRRLDQFVLWLLRHIFPNGYLPKPAELAQAGQRRLVIEDWHNLADDYDLTLLAWGRRFRDGWPELADRYDEVFRRQWEFYLHGCAAAFRAGLVHVQQIVYSKDAAQYRHVTRR